MSICQLTAKDFSRIVVLTGAGISAESGLKTFRDNGGLWEGHKVEDVATPEAFVRSPETVHKFYNMRRRQLLASAKPNAAHRALADFESKFQGDLLVVTQNVDNLHEQAGSINVLHMHGELLKSVCTACGAQQNCAIDLTCETACHECKLVGTVRPDIVWFGEIPKYMDIIERALVNCDLFVSVGTSGNVYPAAGFVKLAYQAGAETVELNLENTGNRHFQHGVYGPAGRILPSFFSLHT